MDDETLSEEHRMLRDSLRRLLPDIAPPEKIAEWDKNENMPTDLLQPLAELGVCGLGIEEEYGGYGKDILGLLMVLEELGRHTTMIAGLYVHCAGYAGMNLSELGSEEQKRRFLPLVVEGKLSFALGLSEPNVGADLASVRTRAEKKGDKVIINGAKRWCSGAGVSEYIYALVRSGPDDQRYKNLSFLIIPTNAPGVTITNIETMGMRGIPTCDVTFDDVEIPVDNIMGGEEMWNQGWSQLAGPTLEVEKLQPSAMALGLATAMVEEAWQYSQEREQFGKKICGHQAVRHMLADVQMRLRICRLMIQKSAEMLQKGQPSAVQTSMTKLYVCEQVRSIAIDCQSVMGAYGYAEGFKMERHVRDALVFPIFGGSSAIQRNNIANLLKLPKG